MTVLRAAASVVLAGVALASCSNASTSGAVGGAPTPSASFVPGPISSGAPTTFAPLPTPTVTSAPACKDGQVIVSVMGQGAGGTFLGAITFTATDGTTCSLTGYPGLEVVEKKGTKAAKVRAARNGSPRTATGAMPPEGEVILGRNTSATASFSWDETPKDPATCPGIVGVEVTPPGLRRTLAPALQASGGGAASTELCGTPSVAYVIRG